MKKFKTLTHNGPVFPKPYQYQKLSVIVNGKSFILSPLAEEMLYAFAKKHNTEYVNDSVYVKNFWNDFKKEIPSELKNTEFPKDWFFGNMISFFEKEKETVKNRTKKEKEHIKEEKEQIKEKHGYAIVDGEKLELANFTIEPAGIYQGRGKHPKRGCWKTQVQPEDITINCTSDIPNPPEGHKWKEVISNTKGLYICYWFENVMNCRKVVMFSRTSSIIQKKEEKKFDVGLNVVKNWDRIKNHIERGLISSDIEIKETATVCKLIMDLGIRVGDEKGKDEADTVGATTLKKRNVSIEGNSLTLDFIGKDSIKYHNTVNVEPILVTNIKTFMNHSSNELLFPDVNSTTVRNYLRQGFGEISAKNFRTAKASKLMSEKLNVNGKDDMMIFKEATIEVAKLLNHKKTVGKNFKEGMDKIKIRMEELMEKKETVNDKRKKGLNKKIRILKMRLELKKKTKDVSPSTSLTNYIDPRIVISWCKERNVELTKVYTKTLLKKFDWATNTEKGFYKNYLIK